MKSWLIIRSWHPPFSYRIKARVPIILLILAMLTFATVICSICVGQFAISPLDVLETLFGAGSSRYTFIIVTLRLPRALVALLVGMGFATAGAILQGLTRNPLASPDVIGISQGASLAAAAVIIIFTNVPIGIIPFAALVGASCMALLVYLLAWRGGSSPTRLILVGVGLAAVSAAFVQIMISAAQIMRVSQALI